MQGHNQGAERLRHYQIHNIYTTVARKGDVLGRVVGPHSVAQARILGLGRTREVPLACEEQIFVKNLL